MVSGCFSCLGFSTNHHKLCSITLYVSGLHLDHNAKYPTAFRHYQLTFYPLGSLLITFDDKISEGSADRLVAFIWEILLSFFAKSEYIL